MKKITILLLSVLSVTGLQAQDYKAPLAKTFTAFDTSSSFDNKVEQSNKLGLIAKKWNTEWVTHYYVAFSKALLSYMEKDAAKRDAFLDEADKERDEAVSILKKENDETYVLAALIANARLAVDGSTRWMKYGKVFSGNLESAKAINPNNPRIYYMEGTSKLYTPKAFGGGKKAAMPYFEKADGLFAKEDDHDIAKPSWGKRINTKYLAECKKEDKE